MTFIQLVKSYNQLKETACVVYVLLCSQFTEDRDKEDVSNGQWHVLNGQYSFNTFGDIKVSDVKVNNKICINRKSLKITRV